MLDTMFKVLHRYWDERYFLCSQETLYTQLFITLITLVQLRLAEGKYPPYLNSFFVPSFVKLPNLICYRFTQHPSKLSRAPIAVGCVNMTAVVTATVKAHLVITDLSLLNLLANLSCPPHDKCHNYP